MEESWDLKDKDGEHSCNLATRKIQQFCQSLKTKPSAKSKILYRDKQAQTYLKQQKRFCCVIKRVILFFLFLFFFLRLLESLSQERGFLNESVIEPNGGPGEPSDCSLSFLLMENLLINVQGNDSDAPGTQRNKLQNLLCQQDFQQMLLHLLS